MYTENKYKRYTVTSALPYANGPVHIGHLAGVYLPADIYVRYLRSQGEDVLFIGGSDEHGVPITIKARNEGITPQEVTDRYHNIIKQAFAEWGISFNIYSRTSSPEHHKTAAAFFKKLYDEGKFIEKTAPHYYDPEAKQFLADRYIVGTCPHCGNERAYGDQCEACGTSLNATDLINPKSTLSGAEPVMKETKHWFLPLDQYQQWLSEWILKDHKDDWKTNVYGQCKSWIDLGLQPRAVTRDLDWGVKVPLPDSEGKVLYVWFDAPIGYISASKQWAAEANQDWHPYWQDADTKLVHFIGKDNIVFHCIIFPAMLHAEGSYILPANVPANEFLNLEGDKISTSRNWAVWLHEYLRDFEGKQDELRYVLCSNAPETKDNDFTWKDYQAKVNNELLAIFGNFVNRTVVLVYKYFGGEVPQAGEWSDVDKAVIEEMKTYPERIGRSIEQYRFREAINEMMNLARLGNKYLTETEPWKQIKTSPETVATTLNLALQICANLAILCEPFLPFTAERINTILQQPKRKWNEAGGINLVVPKHRLNNPVLLFEKVEDSTIDQQIQRLEQIKKENSLKSAPVVPAKANISFDQFGQVDIRVVTILTAEKVAKTKKLLKLTVDTGLDKRTVVSGIAESYSPEELVGKQVLMLVNLEPKEIKGIMSQGMLLMSENADGSLSLNMPHREVKNGSVVK